LLPEVGVSSESNHMCASTWQIPSSTSWLRVWKPSGKQKTSESKKKKQT
jgi:hypothetical protein